MGHFTVAMSARGFEAHGLDFAERIIEALNERYPDIFVEGDARWSPYPDGYFDATYSPGVCEHFEEGPDAVLLRHSGFYDRVAPCTCRSHISMRCDVTDGKEIKVKGNSASISSPAMA